MDDASTISGKLRPLGFTHYADYLASGHWQGVRQRYAASDLPQTCACGAPYTALHHTTYVRLGAERLDDLEPVCNPCHRKLHGKKPKRRAPNPLRTVKVRHVEPEPRPRLEWSGALEEPNRAWGRTPR